MGFFTGIRSVGLLFQSVRGWITVIILFGPTVITAVKAIANGIPTHELVPIVMGCLALSAAFAFYAIHTYDFIVNNRVSRKLNNKIADNLVEVRDAGHQSLEIAAIVDVWVGRDANNKWKQHVSVRKLKTAASKGLVAVTNLNGPAPNLNSQLKLDDVIGLFRSGDIDRVHKT